MNGIIASSHEASAWRPLDCIVLCILICLRTERLGDPFLRPCLSVSERSKSNWNLEVFCFYGEGKTGVPGEKPLEARERTNSKLNPHMASTPGFKPGSHWLEASVLTTVAPFALLKAISLELLIFLIIFLLC